MSWQDKETQLLDDQPGSLREQDMETNPDLHEDLCRLIQYFVSEISLILEDDETKTPV